MPSLELKTNVALADPKSFVVEFGAFAAKILDKPLPAICVSYDYNETLTFNGTFDPAFQLVITSLFNLNPEANQVFSKAFFDFFEEKLGVPGDRGYITFNDPKASNMGHNATTIAIIRGING